MSSSPRILVAIASHGTRQDHFLRTVVAEYRTLGPACRIVVLSNVNKQVEGAEVRVGVPARDPYSLPFAHRRLFAENVDAFDLFIYSEDDTLLTSKNINAFREAQRELEDGEIAGFLRSETRPDGGQQVVTVNGHFRWWPDSVVRRGASCYAQFSNQHSGCYIATQDQLRRAIASGGFLVEAWTYRYDMLVTAATDIYTQCGLRRLINLSRMHDFILPHLANKYFTRMGIPLEDLELQTAMLRRCADNEEIWTGSLVEPETDAPQSRWSKNLYTDCDRSILATIPSGARSVLSIGSSWGANETKLIAQGLDVWAVPIDCVFGSRLESLGIQVVNGPIPAVLGDLGGRRFDAILLDDVLQRTERPVEWLEALEKLLEPTGTVIGTVVAAPNPLSIIRDLRDKRAPLLPSFASNRLHTMNRRQLRSLFQNVGMELTTIVGEGEPVEGATRSRLIGALKARIPVRLVFAAKRVP